MDPKVFGRDSWAMLHLIALKSDEDPGNGHHEDLVTFLELFPRLVQCVYCRHDAIRFSDLLEDFMAISVAVARRELFGWTWRLHNMVNVKIDQKRAPGASVRTPSCRRTTR